jgi:predicted DNA-binding transcriptional regulator AlpA
VPVVPSATAQTIPEYPLGQAAASDATGAAAAVPLSLDLITLIADRVAERLRLDRDRLLDIEEVAGRLGVSVRGVYHLVARDQFPEGYRIGGIRRWDWGEVLKFLRSREGRVPRRGRGRRRHTA